MGRVLTSARSNCSGYWEAVRTLCIGHVDITNYDVQTHMRVIVMTLFKCCVD